MFILLHGHSSSHYSHLGDPCLGLHSGKLRSLQPLVAPGCPQGDHYHTVPGVAYCRHQAGERGHQVCVWTRDPGSRIGPSRRAGLQSPTQERGTVTPETASRTHWRVFMISWEWKGEGDLQAVPFPGRGTERGRAGQGRAEVRVCQCRHKGLGRTELEVSVRHAREALVYVGHCAEHFTHIVLFHPSSPVNQVPLFPFSRRGSQGTVRLSSLTKVPRVEPQFDPRACGLSPIGKVCAAL